MNIKYYFPIWDKLTEIQKNKLSSSLFKRKFSKGDILHNGSSDCTGLNIITEGMLRAFIISDDGREITLYRLFEYDICLFSASCIMNSIQFDVTITAESDTEVIVIPSDTYKNIMEESAPLANYTNEIMASRFSDVMWLMEQVMWKSFDKRLAEFLINEVIIENANPLHITHEEKGLVKLSRGMIEVTNIKALKNIISK